MLVGAWRVGRGVFVKVSIDVFWGGRRDRGGVDSRGLGVRFDFVFYILGGFIF